MITNHSYARNAGVMRQQSFYVIPALSLMECPTRGGVYMRDEEAFEKHRDDDDDDVDDPLTTTRTTHPQEANPRDVIMAELVPLIRQHPDVVPDSVAVEVVPVPSMVTTATTTATTMVIITWDHDPPSIPGITFRVAAYWSSRAPQWLHVRTLLATLDELLLPKDSLRMHDDKYHGWEETESVTDDEAAPVAAAAGGDGCPHVPQLELVRRIAGFQGTHGGGGWHTRLLVTDAGAQLVLATTVPVVAMTRVLPECLTGLATALADVRETFPELEAAWDAC